MKNFAPGYTVKNRAIGGTITSYWTEHLADVLTAESPDTVLLYCGSNDINNGILEEDIIANVSQCYKIVRVPGGSLLRLFEFTENWATPLYMITVCNKYKLKHLFNFFGNKLAML